MNFQMIDSPLYCGYLEEDNTTVHFNRILGWVEEPEDYPHPLTRDGWTLSAEDGRTINYLGIFTAEECANRTLLEEAIALHVKYRTK